MKIKKAVGAGVMSLGLVVGLSGFAGAASGDIDWTGPDSYNRVDIETSHRVDVENDNDLDVDNDNDQYATTGDADVVHNNRGGDAETGSASNDNELDVSASIDNGGSGAAWAGVGGGGGGGHASATISDTGPDSYNRVEIRDTTRVDIENNNNIDIRNDNHQTARSGDAVVADNTRGGSATTGDASNSNSTTVRLDVSN